MANEKRLIDAKPLMEDGWHLVKTGKSNVFLSSMSLADVPTVDAVEVVYGEWIDGCAMHNGKKVYDSIDCSRCEEVFKIESHDREYWKNRFKVCPFCGAFMDGKREDGVGDA